MLIREAVAGDVPGLARVHVDAWRETYAGLIPDEYLAGLTYEAREQFWERVLAHAKSIALCAVDGAGKVVGFVLAGASADKDPQYPGEIYAIYLLKQCHGTGLGRRLLEVAGARLAERGQQRFKLWVVEGNPTRGFYEHMGGKVVGSKQVEFGGSEVTELAYGWEALSGVSHEIRKATPADAPGIARVQVATWQTTYAGIVPDEFLKSMRVERSAERWATGITAPNGQGTTFVAVNPAGDVVGFAGGGPSRDADDSAHIGELYAIYILKSQQGGGIGRRLVQAMARRLQEQGKTHMKVWVLEANPSKHFYERLGARYAASKTIEIGGAQLPERAYIWTDLSPLL